MGKWAAWRHMTEASKREALEAVGHYNRPLQDRGLEGFFMHMHTAWLYLLQAEFKQAGTDIRYRKANGRLDKVDGEPKCWELARCARERWPNPNDPVRANVDLTVAIRNKVEHRWTEAVNLLVAGKAQSLLANYEGELVTKFGPKHSLGNSLRFPVFVGTLSREGAIRLAQEQTRVGGGVRKLISDFEAQLDPATLEDPRYELRIHLIQRTGPKSDADMAIEFLRDDQLTDEQRNVLRDLGRQGGVVVREVSRAVVHHGWFKPVAASQALNGRLPFRFTVGDFISAWKKLGVRPGTNDSHPERTQEQYCIYDEAHRDYVYSPTFIEKLVQLLDNETKWTEFFGKAPTRRVTALRDTG